MLYEVITDVRSQGPQEHPRQAPDDEKKDEGQGVQHGGLECDGSPVHRGEPVEDLDRRGNGHGVGQEGEYDRRRGGHPGDEHVSYNFV